MSVLQWVREKLEQNGREWVQSNYKSCCEFFGVSINPETYSRYIRMAALSFSEKNEVDYPSVDYEQPLLSRTEEDNEECITIRSSDIRTKDQMIDYCKIDITKWDVKKFVVNSWGSESNPNYQCKCWLEKKEIENKDDIRKSFIEDCTAFAPKYETIDYKEIKDAHLLELCVFDFHFGQLSWGEESGADYDIKIAESLLKQCIDNFVQIKNVFPIDRIVLPIGNDFFNVNSKDNTTINNTPQDEDTRPYKTYTNARRIWVEIIDKLKMIAPVDVIIISGNHDHERTMYLGDSLFCWYHNCENVTVNNSPTMRKYYKYGKNFIGYSHGDSEKYEDLPLLMASERPQDWGDSVYREWHTGHLHKNEITEKQRIRIRRIPSLVPNSAWATQKGYNSVREAQAFVWHPIKGLTSVFNFHI